MLLTFRLAINRSKARYQIVPSCSETILSPLRWDEEPERVSSVSHVPSWELMECASVILYGLGGILTTQCGGFPYGTPTPRIRYVCPRCEPTGPASILLLSDCPYFEQPGRRVLSDLFTVCLCRLFGSTTNFGDPTLSLSSQ